MAQFNMNGLDAVTRQLESMAADVDEMAKAMVDAAAPPLKDALTSCIIEAADRGYATGELAESVKANDSKINQYGCFAAVSVSGTDSSGVRNGEKLAYLEYGTSRQQARPVMRKAINMSEGECVAKMQQIFNERSGAG